MLCCQCDGSTAPPETRGACCFFESSSASSRSCEDHMYRSDCERRGGSTFYDSALCENIDCDTDPPQWVRCNFSTLECGTDIDQPWELVSTCVVCTSTTTTTSAPTTTTAAPTTTLAPTTTTAPEKGCCWHMVCTDLLPSVCTAVGGIVMDDICANLNSAACLEATTTPVPTTTTGSPTTTTTSAPTTTTQDGNGGGGGGGGDPDCDACEEYHCCVAAGCGHSYCSQYPVIDCVFGCETFDCGACNCVDNSGTTSGKKCSGDGGEDGACGGRCADNCKCGENKCCADDGSIIDMDCRYDQCCTCCCCGDHEEYDVATGCGGIGQLYF